MMTQPIDQNLKCPELSANATRMFDLRGETLSEWERRVRAEVQAATHLPHPIIIDTFPGLYDSLVEAISPDYPRTSAIATTTIASEHGAERARLTGYDAHSVITEYELMRSSGVDVLTRHGVRLNAAGIDTLISSFDAAIREGVTSFALAESVMRKPSIALSIHELRHPLSTAPVTADILNAIVDTTRSKELTGLLIDNLAQVERKVQDLLGKLVFRTGERLQLHVTNWDVLRLVYEVAHQCSQVHGPRFKIEGTNVRGYWDRPVMGRAVESLLDNALRYSPPGLPIRLHVDLLYERMILGVHNEDASIPSERIESVFQVYWRALAGKQAAPGESPPDVGVPYVRSVAESHGGSVGIESLAGRGTTCIIDLPIDSRPFRNSPTVGTDRY